jgi:threonine synthase
MKSGVLVRYKDFLPIMPRTPLFSLGEGDTPLVRCEALEKEIGCGELYFKLEGCNPTGSFKDRGMVVAVAKAVEAGSKAIMCASTGNTSASAAAYAAYCGLSAIIIVPKGKIALGKLAQAIIYGAKIITIDGNFDQALNIVRSLTQKHPVTLVNSLNPHRIEGQKTAAYAIEAPETVASAIRIGNPASWQRAVAARDESGGVIDMVSDEEILSAQRLLATKGGIFGEPASAASLAGLLKLSQMGIDFSPKRVVCVVTGTGLKDTDTALRRAEPFLELPADLVAVEQALGWG